MTGPYDRWMEHLPESLTKQPLNQLAIPGTHDSFSYCITPSNKLGPDAQPIWVRLNKYFGPLARCLITRWSKTQSLNLTDQLLAGIRYLDLRVGRSADDKDQLYFIHALLAGRVDDEMKRVKEFLMSHPKEVVLLDFNHMYAMRTEDHERLCKMLQEIFGSSIVPYQYNCPTLEDLWSRQQQVVIFYHHYYYPHDYWPGYYIPSPWPNTPKPDQMIAFLEENYGRGRESDWFIVTQGILTPTTQTVITNPTKTLRTALANKANPPFIQWLSTKQAGPYGINVCIIDFMEDEDYVRTVIGLNSTRLPVLQQVDQDPLEDAAGVGCCGLSRQSSRAKYRLAD